MKKIYFLLLTILFIYSNSLSAQRTFILHGVQVPNKNQENFESQEIEYNSKLAQDYVDSGKMRGWALLKRDSNFETYLKLRRNFFWNIEINLSCWIHLKISKISKYIIQGSSYSFVKTKTLK